MSREGNRSQPPATSITANVFTPMLPVEPNTATFVGLGSWNDCDTVAMRRYSVSRRVGCACKAAYLTGQSFRAPQLAFFAPVDESPCQRHTGSLVTCTSRTACRIDFSADTPRRRTGISFAPVRNAGSVISSRADAHRCVVLSWSPGLVPLAADLSLVALSDGNSQLGTPWKTRPKQRPTGRTQKRLFWPAASFGSCVSDGRGDPGRRHYSLDDGQRRDRATASCSSSSGDKSEETARRRSNHRHRRVPGQPARGRVL